jgi:hypothetical protein
MNRVQIVRFGKAGLALCLVLACAASAEAGDKSRIKRGLKIAPVPLDMDGLKESRVGLGSYIVNAQGGCNDCHTAPSYADGGDPFLGQKEQINVDGYLAGGQAFGPFVSRNLTPDEDGLPAGLTFSEFKAIFRKGTDDGGVPPHVPGPGPSGDLLQVMPWPVYGNMVTSDLKAVYEYLSAIPSLPNGPGAP